LLEIRFSSPNPQLAANVANFLAQEYVDHTFKVRYDATMQASQRLSDELASLQQAMNASEAKVIAYQKEHHMVGADQLIGTRLADLDKDLTATQIEKAHKQEQYRLARSTDPDEIERGEANSLVSQLRAKQSELTSQYAKLTSTLGPAHPHVIELKNQLEDVRRSIAGELERMRRRVTNEYLAVARRESSIREALENQKLEATEHNEHAIEYDNLKRDADTNRQLYTDFLLKLKEAELAAGIGLGNIRIETVATVPTKPAKPNVPFNMGMGLLGGSMLGILAAFLLNTLDSKIRDSEEAEIVSGMPALAVIPEYPSSRGRVLDGAKPAHLSLDGPAGGASLIRPESPMFEPYRALRTVMLLQYAPRVLLITSPLPGDGKTTTAVNAAAAFLQNGRRVLLIDADMSNPSIHRMCGFPRPARGLSTVLAGKDEIDDVLLRSPIKENLFIMPAGPVTDTHEELLQHEKLAELISTLKEQFDFIIIDSAPVLGVSDTLFLSVWADAVLLVVRESSTPRQALARSTELLSRANAAAVGIVVNAAKDRDFNTYYYGYGTKPQDSKTSGTASSGI
jgi:capsular exopolysaccharide synthesis family protein